MHEKKWEIPQIYHTFAASLIFPQNRWHLMIR